MDGSQGGGIHFPHSRRAQFDHFFQKIERIEIHRPHPSVGPLAQVVTAVKALPHCDHVIEPNRLLHQTAVTPAAVVEEIERDGTR